MIKWTQSSCLLPLKRLLHGAIGLELTPSIYGDFFYWDVLLELGIV